MAGRVGERGGYFFCNDFPWVTYTHSFAAMVPMDLRGLVVGVAERLPRVDAVGLDAIDMLIVEPARE